MVVPQSISTLTIEVFIGKVPKILRKASSIKIFSARKKPVTFSSNGFLLSYELPTS